MPVFFMGNLLGAFTPILSTSSPLRDAI